MSQQDYIKLWMNLIMKFLDTGTRDKQMDFGDNLGPNLIQALNFTFFNTTKVLHMYAVKVTRTENPAINGHLLQLESHYR